MKRLIKKLRQNQHGFTLIEVLVAVALLSILGSGIMGALTLSSRVLLATNIKENSMNIAQSQMEYVKNQDYVGKVEKSLVGSTVACASLTITVDSVEDFPVPESGKVLWLTIVDSDFTETLSYSEINGNIITLDICTSRFK